MSTTSSEKGIYDAIVIGAGHNGLVTAGYLSKAGLKVLVLERRADLGGAAATEQVFPGFKINTGAINTSLFLPEILTDLGITSGQLEFIYPPALVFAPQPDGSALTLWRDPQQAALEISRYSQKDAEQYPDFIQFVARLAGILREILIRTPPPLPKYTSRDLLTWLPLALKLKRLSNKDLHEFMRVLPMPVSDFLDERFESRALKAAIGFQGVAGLHRGPRESGTTFQFLYQAMSAGEAGIGACRYVQGGTGVLSQTLADAARNHGAEIISSAAVKAVRLEGRRASGVILESGESIPARVVLSGADPRHTFFDLVGARELPLQFVRQVKSIKFRGSTTRINLVLSRLPGLNSASHQPEAMTGHILICSDLDDLERAYDAAKYGEIPDQPCLDILIPTLSDASLAPQGQHVMSIDVRYTPYRLASGDWDTQREALGDLVINVLQSYFPGIQQHILHRQVITPLDYERDYGLAEGCIHHGQMDLDQLLFMRPVAGAHGARTPLPGLYLCGSGAHPGGGVTGAPGYNAARQVLEDLRRAR